VVSRLVVRWPRMGRWAPVKHSKILLPRTLRQLSGYEESASVG
jgi:hypothetical protein